MSPHLASHVLRREQCTIRCLFSDGHCKRTQDNLKVALRGSNNSMKIHCLADKTKDVFISFEKETVYKTDSCDTPLLRKIIERQMQMQKKQVLRLG